MFAARNIAAGPAGRNTAANRRKSFRHLASRAEVTISGRTYDVLDWSLSGISFANAPQDIDVYPQYGTPAPFDTGENVTLALAFYFPGETIRSTLEARIVRRTCEATAVRFAAPPAEVMHLFERVLDHANAEAFLDSQKA
jgi:hypothetical protein